MTDSDRAPRRLITSTIAAELHGDGPRHVLVLHDWNGDHHG